MILLLAGVVAPRSGTGREVFHSPTPAAAADAAVAVAPAAAVAAVAAAAAAAVVAVVAVLASAAVVWIAEPGPQQ